MGSELIYPLTAGALTGVQFIKTSAYVEVTGHIDQTLIGLLANDTGGVRLRGVP
jgi:hypothetical protein